MTESVNELLRRAIKPLEWELFGASDCILQSGQYAIISLYEKRAVQCLCFGSRENSRHDSIEAAKAAAEAHHMDRIMSWIDPAVIEQALAVAEVWAEHLQAALVPLARERCAASGLHEHDGCSCSDAELLHAAIAAARKGKSATP